MCTGHVSCDFPALHERAHSARAHSATSAEWARSIGRMGPKLFGMICRKHVFFWKTVQNHCKHKQKYDITIYQTVEKLYVWKSAEWVRIVSCWHDRPIKPLAERARIIFSPFLEPIQPTESAEWARRLAEWARILAEWARF